MPKSPDEMTDEEFHEWLKPYQPELLALARQMLGLESEPEFPEEAKSLQEIEVSVGP